MSTDEFQQFYDITEYTNVMGLPESKLRSNIPLQIISSKIELGEVPDAFYHIQIPNMVEKHINSLITSPEQFKCDYDNGIIYFDPSKEGQILNVTFYALGKLRHKAENITVKNEKNLFTNMNVEDVLAELFYMIGLNTTGDSSFISIDGGSASTIYTSKQFVNGGNANG